MRRLILARHGESEYSVHGLSNGDPAVDVGLTEAGVEQARRLGALVAAEPLDLCVTSGMRRTQLTAELALAGRDIPCVRQPELNDPGYGRFEGLHVDEYRAWAWNAPSGDVAPGDGESRRAIVSRYVEGYAALLERSEATILAVLHALPIAYVLLALEGQPPAARIDHRIEYAQPYPVTAEQLHAAVGVLRGWLAAPTW